jgi:tRNA(Arg) A34 adenosine deaminase TadA
MQYPHVDLRLPDWMDEFVEKYRATDFSTDEAMMRFAIALGAENVKQGTGGPFGAAIFVLDPSDGKTKLLAPGVNRVVPDHNSEAHAETMAQGVGQQMTDSYSLLQAGLQKVTLVTSCEPCAKCMGSIEWAGINRVVIGATKDHAESIGFNEGNKPPNWREYLRNTLKIDLREGVCVDEVAAVFEEYKRKDGIIYNGDGMGLPRPKIRLETNGSLISRVVPVADTAVLAQSAANTK